MGMHTKNTPPRQMPNKIAAPMLRLRSKRKGVIAVSFFQHLMAKNEQNNTPAVVSRTTMRALSHAYAVPLYDSTKRRQTVAATKIQVPVESKRSIWPRSPIGLEDLSVPRLPV